MAFPNTGRLSPLDPPAESPVSEGGRWGPLTPERDQLSKNAFNQLTNTTFGLPDYSVWLHQALTGDAEVWGCLGGGGLGAALETWRIGLFQDIGFNFVGYQLYYGGALSKDLVLRRYDGGITDFTGIGGAGGVGSPGIMGMRINGDFVEAWTHNSGEWELAFAVFDPTYRGTFYATFGLEDPTAGGLSFDCVGGGTPHFAQFFRWLWN